MLSVRGLVFVFLGFTVYLILGFSVSRIRFSVSVVLGFMVSRILGFTDYRISRFLCFSRWPVSPIYTGIAACRACGDCVFAHAVEAFDT